MTNNQHFQIGRSYNFIIVSLKQKMDKFKIQIILRSSPDKQKMRKDNLYKLSLQNRDDGVLYSRTPSAITSLHKDNHINLRDRIINPKHCFARPTSKKQKQSQMFTEKCLQILSKKKNLKTQSLHQTKMHSMMTNVVDKYKKVIHDNKNELVVIKKNFQSKQEYLPKTQAITTLSTGFEDRIQVYRMIRSSELPKTKEQAKDEKKQAAWKSKPDVTGIRMNRFLKFHDQQFQGIQCFSLPISQIPLTKRQSLIFSQPTPAPIQRVESSKTERRKISIIKTSTQKFMAFSLNQDSDSHYMKKLKSFLDFIFKINYSNKIYINLQLCDDPNNIKKYKVYIGKGNNSLLIKSLLKRRFWLQIVDSIDDEDINFYWTQNKVNKIHYKQPISKNVKLIKERRQLIKKREMKDLDSQLIEFNKKILSIQDSYSVQQFICKDGFYIPREEKFVCNIVTNHLPRNTSIGSKKNLFKSLLHYYRDIMKTDPFQYIPKTYNVKGPEDPQFKRFLRDYESEQKKVWIVKPGQNSNRGNGIKLSQTLKIIDLIRKKEKHENGKTKTYILQSYIEKPFLYNGRKFDIRHYMMITSVNGILKAYWYKQGYIRTSSEKYDIDDLNNEQMHLTNDAIQKKYDEYQKYEPGNKLSYAEFQRYLDITFPNKNFSFEKDIIPKMKSVILDVVKANYNIIDKNRRDCNFQIFGFDFMIDREFKPWLIQINFNPCLEINCPVLTRIIPSMVENSLRIGLDPLLPPLNHYPGNKRFSLTDNFLRNLKYQLLFDEASFEQTVPVLHEIESSDDEEQQYVDEGKQIEDLVI